MMWRTVLVLGLFYAFARSTRQSDRICRNLFEPSCLDRLPTWWTNDVDDAVICITWDRRPKHDISVFRRLLTVTNLMLLAGNKPGLPKPSKAKSHEG